MNVPQMEMILSKHDPARRWFAVVTSGAPDRFEGCYWHLYDMEGQTVSYGHSRGWNGDGAGSALSAMKLAKAAARRRDKP
jgi:hypothetical protein